MRHAERILSDLRKLDAALQDAFAMHYKNGRQAKVGDRVVVLNNGKPMGGVLVEANPGSTSCNGRVIPEPVNAQYVTLSDCIHAEDVEAKTAVTAATS